MKIKRLLVWLRSSIVVNAIRNFSQNLVLPGFDGMSLYEVSKFTLEAFFRSDIMTKSAAISFRLFISLFPALILLVSLIPYIPIDNFQQTLLNSIYSILPNSAESFLSTTIEDLVTKKHTAFLSIGFILTIYYASNIINSILSTFSSSYQIQAKRNFLKQRIISFGLMLLITVLMLVGFALILFGESYLTYLTEDVMYISQAMVVLIQIIKWVSVVFLFNAAISALYNVAFIERKKWKIISSGASVATIGIILVSLGFSFFIDNFSSFNKLYGSIGSLIVFLLWINVSSTILIIGFELYAKTNNKYSSVNE